MGTTNSMPDILRRRRKKCHVGSHVPPVHRAIPYGPLHSRRRLPPNVGLFARRRPTLLPFLSPHLSEAGLHTCPGHLGLRIPCCYLRPTVLDSTCGSSGALQSRSFRQQSCMGSANLCKSGMGTTKVQTRAFLYRKAVQHSNRVGGRRFPDIRHVSIIFPVGGPKPYA